MPVDLIDEFAPRKMSFYLVPRQWHNYPDNADLNWNTVYFDQANRTRVPARSGVYCFCLQPGIASGLAASYVLYVGKAEKSTIRERYNEYLRKVNADKVRPRIGRMLEYWHQEECLYFTFSVLEAEDPDQTEDELLSAFVPPLNTELPAEVHAPVRALR